MKAGWPGSGSSIPVEFVGGLHKQAVNQWTGWMGKKDSRHYVQFHTHVLHVINFATVMQTPGSCISITKET